MRLKDYGYRLKGWLNKAEQNINFDQPISLQSLFDTFNPKNYYLQDGISFVLFRHSKSVRGYFYRPSSDKFFNNIVSAVIKNKADIREELLELQRETETLELNKGPKT